VRNFLNKAGNNSKIQVVAVITGMNPGNVILNKENVRDGNL
jgi:hypothetical protein